MIAHSIFNPQLAYKAESYAIVVVYILFFVGIISHISGLENLMITITEEFILLCNFVVTFFSLWRTFAHKGSIQYSIIFALFLIAVVTFALEVIGVKTGLVFGEYYYGKTFQISLFQVPVIIGWNWVIVIVSTSFIAQNCIDRAKTLIQKIPSTPLSKINKKYRELFSLSRVSDVMNALVISILSGSLAVVFDILLEPVAVNYDYWSWFGRPIPLQNYSAWFVITFCISILIQLLKMKLSSRFLTHYFLLQFVFFALLNLHLLR